MSFHTERYSASTGKTSLADGLPKPGAAAGKRSLAFASIRDFVQRQYRAVKQGGWLVFRSKVRYALLRLLSLIFLPPALPFFPLMRLLRPWILIRISPLNSDRIGHFAVNTELYLCEREAGINVPNQRHVDLCYHAGRVANKQLAKMWGRCLRIWPAWLLGPVYRLNGMFPGGAIHKVANNTQHDRDVLNLLERTPPHLSFTPEEEVRGKAGLREMGIPDGSEFICLATRDDSYLRTVYPHANFDYHNYRDVDVNRYVPAAEALADMGYYVIRVGAVVKAPLRTSHRRIIDYAVNGMRSDFMDIYLGANCLFALGSGVGFNGIQYIFRRPIALASVLSIGYVPTFLRNLIFICKNHWLTSEQRRLSLKEIFSHGVGFCMRTSEYEAKGVEVIENTPEEIKALAIEMLKRLKGTWQPEPDDDALQRRFWEIFPVDARDVSQHRPLHGKVRARYGAQFLRDNRDWLD